MLSLRHEYRSPSPFSHWTGRLGTRFGTDGNDTRNLPPTVPPASEDCQSLMHYIRRRAAQSGERHSRSQTGHKSRVRRVLFCFIFDLKPTALTSSSGKAHPYTHSLESRL